MKQMINIGIIGTGRIASRFLEESKFVNNVNIAAVFNPHIESTIWFAQQNHIDIDGEMIFTDDLDVLFEVVDAVYIATPHETHAEYAKLALKHGRHVLCEKPLALKQTDAQEIFDLAEKKNKICMEAIKTAYCPGFLKIMQLVKAKVIGNIHDIDAAFTKIGTAAGREMWRPCGGSFTELGSYVLLPVVKLYGTEKTDVHTYSLESALGTDSYTKMMLGSSKGVATVKTGLGIKTEGELIISGDDGYIKVPSPWWLTKRIEVHHENPNQVEVYEVEFAGGGLRYEIEALVSQIQNSDAAYENVGISKEESIWLAQLMEQFLGQRTDLTEKQINETENYEKLEKVGIWAHRGCSMVYPENTLLSFQRAAEIAGITGIEFDVQLTKDRELVVIHDEKVDRTTNGSGYVKDYTLKEIQQMSITGSGNAEIYRMTDADKEKLNQNTEVLHIPTLREVFQLLAPFCKNNGLQLNIELKNSIVPYEGMEQQLMTMVLEYGLEEYIVYSSFNHVSMGYIKWINPQADVAFLDGDYHRCMDSCMKYKGNAIHPWQTGMPLNRDALEEIQGKNIPVRMWNACEPLYGQPRILPEFDLRKYYRLGATDIFTNVPERYCTDRRK